MAGIQLTGLVSGLDTASIIDQLMTVEKAPRQKITLQQDATVKRQSLLNEIGTKLTAVKTANDDLKSILTWLDTQAVTSADPAKVTVARTAGAAPGGYDVGITQLATAERRTYGFVSPTVDGPLTVLNADGTTRASVSLKAGATIDDAVSAINSQTDAKLYAVNVSGQLVLAAKTTGLSSGFSVTGAGAGAQLQVVPGQNAKISINGTAYERESNTITDALAGVTLTLKAKTAGTDTVGVTVGTPGPDKDLVTAKVNAFVKAYNDLITTTKDDLGEKRVPNAKTTAAVQQGTLFGDSALTGMLTSLRSVVSSAVSGLSGTITSLADIGISTGAANTSGTINQDAVDGKLTVDTTKLTAALDSNPLGVRTLLGGVSGTDGFSQAFGASLAGFQGSSGLIASRVSSAASDLTDMKTRLDDFDTRMTAKQARYQKQFTALEAAMQASQTQSNSLASYTKSLG
jgi:flagellar hook-associated protein 2